MKKQKAAPRQNVSAASPADGQVPSGTGSRYDDKSIDDMEFDDIDFGSIDEEDLSIGSIDIDDTDFDEISEQQPDTDDDDVPDVRDFDADDLNVSAINIETALHDFLTDDEESGQIAGASEQTANTAPPSKHSRVSFPYVVIGVLSAAVITLGGLTLMSLNRLVSMQSRVSQLQQTVTEISASASTLSQKAKELKALQEDEENSTDSQNSSSQTAEVQGPQFPGISEETGQEEGMLSPSSGKNQTFTNNTDNSMDSLLVQIEPLLPQNNGTWSVYVCNLKKGTEGTIGGGKMQAASLIKLYIMGAVYENYQSLAQLHGKDNLDGYLRSMITVSDNDAANILVNWLGSGDDANGMQMVNDFCISHGYTETSMGRLLLQSNEYGDNYTSVSDCGRFLKEIYELNTGAVSNSTLSHADSMYALLKQQQRTNKIPANLPEGVHVANKTGELSNVENDAGIIYDTAQGIDLVVCFMSENLSDTAAAQASIAENTRLIYGYYNE